MAQNNWITILESLIIKYTNQRVAILNYLRDNLNHPTAEEIYKEIQKKLPRITKATVYKNLKILSQEGLIREVDTRGVSRFEGKIQPHHHLICKKCGKISDFESKELINFALQLIKNQNEFEISETETNFYGLCGICKTK